MPPTSLPLSATGSDDALAATLALSLAFARQPSLQPWSLSNSSYSPSSSSSSSLSLYFYSPLSPPSSTPPALSTNPCILYRFSFSFNFGFRFRFRQSLSRTLVASASHVSPVTQTHDHDRLASGRFEPSPPVITHSAVICRRHPSLPAPSSSTYLPRALSATAAHPRT
jgi:hypothetical protein